MKLDDATILRQHGISPSAQRVAVAKYVLHTGDHPSADEVWSRVQKRFHHISRATVYNTLHLLVEHGLLKQLVLAEGRLVFDPKIDRHHHLIDEATGEICDIPWDTLKVSNISKLDGFDVTDYQVVMRGKRTPPAKKQRRASKSNKKGGTSRG